jgi:hypothetical protein
MYKPATLIPRKRGLVFTLVLITFSLGQVIGLLLAYGNAFYMSEIIRETGLVNIDTGIPVTIGDLTIGLLVNTFFCVTGLIGLYGVWVWKKWGVYTLLVMGLFHLLMGSLSSTSLYNLRLGLGLVDLTTSSFIALGPTLIQSPIPTIIALVFGVGVAIYRRWQWFD